MIQYVSTPVKFLSYSHEKKMQLHKMLPCCLIFVPDSIPGEDKYPPTSTMRTNVQQKRVQRLIKPMLWYGRKTGRMDELKHDSQNTLQPLLLPVWGTVLSEQWGALENGMHWKMGCTGNFNSHCCSLGGFGCNPFNWICPMT